MAKPESYRLWQKFVYPLIKKRNKILDIHNNSLDAFDLPEIRMIDAQIDALEIRLYEFQFRDQHDFYMKKLEKIGDRLKDLEIKVKEASAKQCGKNV